MKIFNRLKFNFLTKAYTEGIYADTPANRKLGRVGMTYAEYAQKIKKEDKEEIDINELKKQQFEIVEKYNPSDESLSDHTWIRSVDDIKTLDEVINDEEEFMYPDFSVKDAKEVKKSGKIKIYSSHPISEGVFISPSKMCAQDYAGGDKVYSKEVNIEDVAWIDSGQGQYTPIKQKEKTSESKITKKEGEKKAAEIIKKQVGFDVDFTFRKEKEFTISFEGSDKSKISKIQKIFKDSKIESEYDEELNETFCYVDLNNKKPFTFEQIKEKVKKEFDKLKKKNDYVTISTTNGYTFRFGRNMSGENTFNECLVKDKDKKVLKTFKNSHEEDLMNSVYNYIQSLGVDVISSEDGGKDDINIEHNTATIKKKMQEAKDNQTGTILVKGSGDKLIYLNRDRNGRWLKDFNNYTIRDSKRNIISQGKADSEEKLINKLNEYLSKNKIKLEI